MNRPLNQGSKVGARRYRKWLARFSSYRNPVTQQLIEFWLDQFAPHNKDLAARVLDCVLFITHQHVSSIFRQLLESIAGWDWVENKRSGRWFFVPFSGSSGESGDTMVHAFRWATSMTARSFNSLFILRSELVEKKLTTEDTVVLIDDFSGSGKQACDSWKAPFAELLAGGPRSYLC